MTITIRTIMTTPMITKADMITIIRVENGSRLLDHPHAKTNLIANIATSAGDSQYILSVVNR